VLAVTVTITGRSICSASSYCDNKELKQIIPLLEEREP
jgi:hypothetical protein